MLRISFFIIMMISKWTSGQVNLVPNSSFEIISQCPFSQGQLDFAAPWFHPTTQDPELYNACEITGGLGVPNNSIGYQQAKTGNGYSGGGFWGNGSNARDYFSVKLLDTLMANKNYFVEFYVSLANKSIWGIDKIGIYFSDTIIDNIATLGVINYIPQIEYPFGNIIGDTIYWTKISGIYNAIGGEQFIIIGNFYPDTLTDTLRVNPAGTLGPFYYLDDVYVGEAPDTTVYEISVYPNSNNGNFTVNYNLGDDETGMFYLYDAIGRRVYKKELEQNNGTLQIELFLSSGVYIWELRGSKRIQSGKIVVVNY